MLSSKTVLNTGKSLYTEVWNKKRLKKVVKVPFFEDVHRNVAKAFGRNIGDDAPGGLEGDAPGEFDTKLSAIVTKCFNILENLEKSGNGCERLSTQYKPSSFKSGRQYVVDGGYQSIPFWIRSYCGGRKYYHDIDIQNCYPALLLKMCEDIVQGLGGGSKEDSQESLRSSALGAKALDESMYLQLKEYVYNREEYLQNEMEFVIHTSKSTITRSDAKRMFLITLHFGTVEKHFPGHKVSPELQNFRECVRRIAKYFTQCPQYSKVWKKVATDSSKKNKYGTFISRIIQQQENNILMNMLIPFLEERGYSVDVLCFDGCMIRKREFCDEGTDDTDSFDGSCNDSYNDCTDKPSDVNEFEFLKDFASVYGLPKYLRVCEKPFDNVDVIVKSEIAKAWEKYEAFYSFRESDIAEVLLPFFAKDVISVPKGKRGNTFEYELYHFNKENRLWEETNSLAVSGKIPKILKREYKSLAKYTSKRISKVSQQIEKLQSESELCTSKGVRSSSKRASKPRTSLQDRHHSSDHCKAELNKLQQKRNHLEKTKNFLLTTRLTQATSSSKCANLWKFLVPLLVNNEFGEHCNGQAFPELFPLRKGKVLNLRTCTIENMKREHYFITASKCSGLGNAERIEEIMTDVQPNLQNRRYLQAIGGFALTGELPDRNFFVLLGNSSNGKSVFIRLLNALFPLEMSCPLKKQVLAGKKRVAVSASGHSEHYSKLASARMAFVSESNPGDKLFTDTMKALTGGDIISYRPAHGRESSFICFAKIFFLSNHVLSYLGDDACNDRIRYIQFPNSFVEFPDPSIPSQKQKDPELIKKTHWQHCELK